MIYPKCVQCGNRLTEKEFIYNENYRQIRKEPYQCWHCSQLELKKVIDKVNEDKVTNYMDRVQDQRQRWREQI